MHDIQEYNPYLQTIQNKPLRSMTVTGEGNISVRPDEAIITLGVVTENPSVQTAQQENTIISNRVISTLKQMDIKDSDIKTTNYSIYPRYEYSEGQSILRGYTVEHFFEIIVKNIPIIGSIYEAAINSGANRSGSIQFRVSNASAYYQEALKRAIFQARQKAETIALTIGAKLINIPIKLVEQSNPQPIRPIHTFASTSSETPPIQTGASIIQAVVEVVYSYR